MRDPLHFLSVKYKLALGFVGLCTLAFGVGGYLISKSARGALETEILRRLEFQCQAYANDLGARLDTLTRRSEDFASDGYIRDHVAALRSDRLAAADRERLRGELRRHLRLNKLPLEPAFVDLLLVDAEGRVVTTVRDSTPTAADHDLAHWAVGLETSAVSGIIADPTDAGITLAIATPLLDIHDRHRIGHLLARVRTDIWTLTALRSASFGPGRERRGTRLRLYDPSGRLYEVLKPEAAGTSNRDMYLQSYPVGSSGWTAEVGIRSSAALAPVSGLQSRFLVVGLFLAALSVLLLYFPLRYLANPLIQLRAAAHRIRGGDFSARVEIDSEDEVGELARAFNLMAAAVESRTSELEASAEILKQRQLELRDQRDRLDRVISTMRDGLVVLDAEGEVLLSNHAAGPLLEILRGKRGTPAGASAHNCPFDSAGSSPDCVDCLLDPNAQDRSCAIESAGRIYEVHVTPVPLTTTGRHGRILVSRDISERVARDEREIHQERLAVLGEVAATMAHELNNPLASISLFNQMLEAKLPADSPLRENVEVIARNTQTCKQVIAELLGYATGSPPETSEMDLHEILEDAARFLQPLARRKSVEISWDLAADRSMVHGDEVQFRQVFVNLLMNAIQAVDGEGRVEIASFNEGTQILVEVRDTGHGIPPEDREAIFRPFFTTKPRGEGTGLGLPTAQRILEMCGGGLQLVESSERGTTFRVRLRLVETMKEKESLPR